MIPVSTSHKAMSGKFPARVAFFVPLRRRPRVHVGTTPAEWSGKTALWPAEVCARAGEMSRRYWQSLFHTVKYKSRSVKYINHSVKYKFHTVKRTLSPCPEFLSADLCFLSAVPQILSAVPSGRVVDLLNLIH